MADIIPLSGLNVSTMVNGIVFRLTRGRIRIGSLLLQFATTGQTIDPDLKAWMNTLEGGVNTWEFESDGYVDHNVTPASRLQGNNLKFRPGTRAAGVLQALFAAGHGFSGTAVIDQLEVGWDAEGNKPISARVGGKGDGPITYINA